MAKPLAGMMFEEAAERALREIGAIGTDRAVRTSALAKAMRRLGCPLKRDDIHEKLNRFRTGSWGRRFSYFIGGTNDDRDAFAWAILGE